MIAIQFKKDSGSAATDFNAVIVQLDYYVPDPTEYDDINRTLRRTVDVNYKQWNIRFARLTETQMDYLNALKKENAPQFIYEATTYNVRLADIKPRPFGGTITVINIVKES